MDFDWDHGPLSAGLRHYRRAEFFEAHEAWEAVWLHSTEPDKTFLQGLIQVAAAYYHLQRKNPEGTVSLMEAALRRLESYPESFGGVDVALLCGAIRQQIVALKAGGTERNIVPPRIRTKR